MPPSGSSAPGGRPEHAGDRPCRPAVPARPEVSLNTLGIDLAAQPAGTAACLLAWEGARAHALALRADLGDAALTSLREDAATVAIDAPFGWPRAFSEALAAWGAGGRWTGAPDRDLRYRLTDLQVRERTGLWPLSVSSDRIAVCAWRCARLLSQWGARDRLGADGVIEVYPAGALCCWRLPFRGYKARAASGRAAAEAAREQLVAGIRKRWPGLDLSAAQWEACRASHDVLDALVCALVAREFARGRTVGPGGHDGERVRDEGWIHLPAENEIENDY